MARACIVTIGNELLQGRILDTNSQFLSRKLTVLGHSVVARVSVGDDIDDIGKALSFCVEDMQSDLVITTGGLGPTPDDMTMQAVAKFLGKNLVLNELALSEVERKYRERNLPLTEDRIKMAMLPEGATPIPNPVGVAPGALISTSIAGRSVTIVVLPGVPREMEAMFEHFVEPRIRGNRVLVEVTLLLKNVRESDLASILKQLMKTYANFYIKSHPLGHEVREPSIRLYASTYSDDVARALDLCEKFVKEAVSAVKSAIPSAVIELEHPCRVAQ